MEALFDFPLLPALPSFLCLAFSALAGPRINLITPEHGQGRLANSRRRRTTVVRAARQTTMAVVVWKCLEEREERNNITNLPWVVRTLRAQPFLDVASSFSSSSFLSTSLGVITRLIRVTRYQTSRSRYLLHEAAFLASRLSFPLSARVS